MANSWQLMAGLSISINSRGPLALSANSGCGRKWVGGRGRPQRKGMPRTGGISPNLQPGPQAKNGAPSPQPSPLVTLPPSSPACPPATSAAARTPERPPLSLSHPPVRPVPRALALAKASASRTASRALAPCRSVSSDANRTGHCSPPPTPIRSPRTFAVGLASRGAALDFARSRQHARRPSANATPPAAARTCAAPSHGGCTPPPWWAAAAAPWGRAPES